MGEIINRVMEDTKKTKIEHIKMRATRCRIKNTLCGNKAC